MKPIRKVRLLRGVLAAVFLLVAGDAMAIVGRPLTPVSYAGVARRTVRRSAYVAAPVAAGAAVATGVAVGTAVATLPHGCNTMAGGYYACGGNYYQQTYDGPNLVYVAVPPP